MAQKKVTTNWDRYNRNVLNHNFDELYDSTGKAIDAADKANKEADNAKSKASDAKDQADYAKSQGDYAKDAADDVVKAKTTFRDDDNDKTYEWGLKYKDGHLIFMFEEE